MSLVASRPVAPRAVSLVEPIVGCTLRVCLGPVDLVSQLLVLYGLFSEKRGGGAMEKSTLTISTRVQ